ncbi:hypothetical protein ACSQ67_000390 [Phaseolus vulgaris]
MVKGSEIDGVEVPEAMIETLNRTLGSLQQLETELPQFLSLSDPDLLAQLPLLELKLRCRGVNPNDHPVKSELDKINVLQKKLERLARLSEAQEQDMRNINGGEGPEMNYEERAGQKRKYPSSEEPSVQIDHMESLEKVKEEHLGYDTENVKGTVVIDISDDDDDEVLAP